MSWMSQNCPSADGKRVTARAAGSLVATITTTRTIDRKWVLKRFLRSAGWLSGRISISRNASSACPRMQPLHGNGWRRSEARFGGKYWNAESSTDDRARTGSTTEIGRERHGCGGLNIPEWIRTTNLRLRRPTLYPVELRGRKANLTIRHAATRPNYRFRTTFDWHVESTSSKRLLCQEILPVAAVARKKRIRGASGANRVGIDLLRCSP